MFLFFVKRITLTNKGISVVIPNYNGETLLPLVLPALFAALDTTLLPYEVIVSDDNSTDNSISFLKKNYPAIKLLTNATNQGFGPTINKGIFIAQFDLIFLMNSDVKLENNYFQPLLRYFDQEDTFGVMGRIIGWNDNVIQDGAKYPSFHGVKIKTSGNYILNNPSPHDWLYSIYLSGANALVSKEKILQLTGFNDAFAPYYIEDYELSLRAWRVGWKCYYEHFAVCRHQTSTTIKSKSKKNEIKRVYYRNKMLLHAIHLPTNKLWIWYLQLIPETLMHLLTGRVYFIRAIIDFLGKRKEVTLSKEAIKNLGKHNHQLYSIHEITCQIIKSIKGFSIQRF